MMPIGRGFFGGAPPIFMLFFIITFGIVVFVMIGGIISTIRNAKAPIITVQARVIAKRTNVSTHHHNTGNNHTTHHSSTSYYITFETEHGERLELPLSGRMYGQLIEGDEGDLTYQGEWFKDFRRYGL